SRRRHTRSKRDWSSDVCSSDLLWAVVNTSNGTGIAARIPGLDIAGKTGTAQTIANSKSEKGQDHAWFASFAPARDPEVVIVVLEIGRASCRERGGRWVGAGGVG